VFLRSHGDFDRLEERNNLLREAVEERQKVRQSLPVRRQRAAFLFKASQRLIELIDTGEILDFLIHAFGDLFPQADTALLFEFDHERDALALARSLKPEHTIIKQKEGNFLDVWVLRHNRSLVIEDITKDFRFDCRSIDSYSERAMRSFIVNPLSIAHTVFGVGRVESRDAGCFSLEDSRLMRNICDLGAVVLERARLFKHAQDLAISDPLTSLFVKDYFFKQLRRQCQYSRETNSKLGLIMLDIDNFKQINDRYGHILGDAVLRRISRLLTSVAGDGNIIARFGGEEFIIALPGISRQETIRIAQDVRSAVEKSGLLFRRQKVVFSVSAGVAVYPDDALDALELVEAADKLLYQAKRQGKNRVCYSG